MLSLKNGYSDGGKEKATFYRLSLTSTTTPWLLHTRTHAQAHTHKCNKTKQFFKEIQKWGKKAPEEANLESPAGAGEAAAPGLHSSKEVTCLAADWWWSHSSECDTPVSAGLVCLSPEFCPQHHETQPKPIRGHIPDPSTGNWRQGVAHESKVILGYKRLCAKTTTTTTK